MGHYGNAHSHSSSIGSHLLSFLLLIQFVDEGGVFNIKVFLCTNSFSQSALSGGWCACVFVCVAEGGPGEHTRGSEGVCGDCIYFLKSFLLLWT